MRFRISTHLTHGQRLTREHLVDIARHGFKATELFATRSHFDYHNPSAIDTASRGRWIKPEYSFTRSTPWSLRVTPVTRRNNRFLPRRAMPLNERVPSPKRLQLWTSHNKSIHVSS